MEERQIMLSVVIVNWNTEVLLKQCLVSLYENLPLLPTEIIVVDNGSSDGSIAMLKANFSDIILIRNKENLGYAKANNLGMERSKGKYIVLLNSDTKIDHDVFGQLVNYMEKNPHVSILGPRLKNYDGSLQFSIGSQPSLWGVFCQQGLPLHVLPIVKKHVPVLLNVDKNKYKFSHDTGWVKGACFLIRRTLYKKIGGLDESIFMYMEEVEYCKRTWNIGRNVRYFADVSVWHLERGSSKDGNRSAILGIYIGLYHYFQVHKPRWQLGILSVILKFGAIIRLGKDFETYWQAFKIPCGI